MILVCHMKNWNPGNLRREYKQFREFYWDSGSVWKYGNLAFGKWTSNWVEELFLSTWNLGTSPRLPPHTPVEFCWWVHCHPATLRFSLIYWLIKVIPESFQSTVPLDFTTSVMKLWATSTISQSANFFLLAHHILSALPQGHVLNLFFSHHFQYHHLHLSLLNYCSKPPNSFLCFHSLLHLILAHCCQINFLVMKSHDYICFISQAPIWYFVL